MIQNYTYMYFISSSLVEIVDNSTNGVTEATSLVLTELEKYTEYNITVQANTINGSGPGVSIVVRTDSDSKFTSPLFSRLSTFLT